MNCVLSVWFSQVDKNAETAAKWKYCALSQEELKYPIVACELGKWVRFCYMLLDHLNGITGILAYSRIRLYNKDAIIEYLLDKSTSNDAVSHIRNLKVSFLSTNVSEIIVLLLKLIALLIKFFLLKDVTELKLSLNPNYQKDVADKGDDYVGRKSSEFICPVTGLEMNGKYRFVFLMF